MTGGQFILGTVRLAAILLPPVLAARALRRSLPPLARPLGVLAEAVIAIALLVLAAELLGLLGLLRWPALAGLLFLAAAGAWRLAPGPPPHAAPASLPASAPMSSPPEARSPLAALSATVGLVAVLAQWSLQTANSLGSGMPSFDTLWYHMPFAARFAQAGSVTAIQFTQADPFVAYYPANSELLHAIGIIALKGDLLSPLLNLGWLALALLGAWCLGRPWGVELLTLAAASLVLSLPVLSGTQPGEAFNDVAGLACLLAAAALALAGPGERRLLAVAGLALGLAVGTKLTFLVPAAALSVGLVVLAPSRRRRALLALALGLAATGGWWYLRNLLDVGNPLALSMHVGPVTLPGPSSPLAGASQRTVASALSHLSLWGSRFAPGFSHAFGPLWPLVLILSLAGVTAAGLLVADRRARVLAAVAALAGLSYLVLPTGATGIEQGTTQFQVNLRYLTPALMLGVLLAPIVLRLRAPRGLRALAPSMLVLLLAAQLEHSLWPTQTGRHAAFALACAGLAGLGWWARARWRRRAPRPRGRQAVLLGAALFAALAAIGFLTQRHYFARRYLQGDRGEPALGSIYAWAQGVADTRIALYGTVRQYPLYGARDTNAVDYLGAPTSDGGYRPIATCAVWRAALRSGRFDYVVLTPAPTRAVPVAWTAGYPGARLLLHPAGDYYVFRLPPAAGNAGGTGC